MYSALTDTWFFTASIDNWQRLLYREERINILLNSLRYFCGNKRILLHAFVIMPNHIHLLLTLCGEETPTTFQRDILKFTSHKLIGLLINNDRQDELNNYISTQKDRIYQIWERRSKWIKIDNMLILQQKMNYIHSNPLQERWKLAGYPEAYPWSSAAYYSGDSSPFDFLTDPDYE